MWSGCRADRKIAKPWQQQLIAECWIHWFTYHEMLPYVSWRTLTASHALSVEGHDLVQTNSNVLMNWTQSKDLWTNVPNKQCVVHKLYWLKVREVCDCWKVNLKLLPTKINSRTLIQVVWEWSKARIIQHTWALLTKWNIYLYFYPEQLLMHTNEMFLVACLCRVWSYESPWPATVWVESLWRQFYGSIKSKRFLPVKWMVTGKW